MKATLIVAVIALLAVAAMAEDLSLDRVWVVDDSFPNAALFRGNSPTQGSGSNYTFAYDQLMDYLRIRANNATNITNYPTNNSRIYLIDITFENLFDHDYNVEEDFWKNPANKDKGELKQWLLVGAPIWATGYSKSEQDKAIEDGKVWKTDKIPTRIAAARQILANGPPPGYDFLSLYVHCAGGCDRTGEFIASYRMNYMPTAKLTTQYHLDVEECGRAPNYFASGAIGWYCLTWNLYNSSAIHPPMPDCLTAYKCKLFKSCEPTGV